VAHDRLSAVLSVMADSGEVAAGSLIDRVCAAAVTLLSLSEAGLSLIADDELRGSAGALGPSIAAVQELQLTLGEGPCVDAWRTKEAVLESDLANPTVVRWPAFAAAGLAIGARAVFAFPLQLGPTTIGVLALYRERTDPLTIDEYSYGLVLADLASYIVLGLQAGAPAGSLHELLSDQPAHWAEIHQATGIVSVQLRLRLDEAFVRLRTQAFVEGRSLGAIAHEVVTHALRLEDWT
jgi:GAF domain